MKVLTGFVLLFWLHAAVAPPVRAQDRLSGSQLVEALRRGGYTLYFRHAATDWTHDDHVTDQGDWTSCDPEKMRQLSPAGMHTAQKIGKAIRSLAIPVGRVYASEYCRTRATARQMDLGPVTPTVALMNLRAAEFVGGQEAVISRARRLISTPPPAGTNTVLVAHGNLMQAATSAYTGEAGAVIFQRRGDEAFQQVAQLAPEDWEALARRFAAAAGKASAGSAE